MNAENIWEVKIWTWRYVSWECLPINRKEEYTITFTKVCVLLISISFVIAFFKIFHGSILSRNCWIKIFIFIREIESLRININGRIDLNFKLWEYLKIHIAQDERSEKNIKKIMYVDQWLRCKRNVSSISYKFENNICNLYSLLLARINLRCIKGNFIYIYLFKKILMYPNHTGGSQK